MAKQLIGDMTHPWKADEHADTFTAAVHELVNRKLKAGDTEKVTPLDEAPSTSGSNVVDLTQLLAQSLASRKSGAASKPAAKSAAVKKKAVRRPAAKRA
jgi:DNA end-binding protein Ku